MKTDLTNELLNMHEEIKKRTQFYPTQGYDETFDEFCRNQLALGKGEPDQRRYLADLLYQWNENKRREK